MDKKTFILQPAPHPSRGIALECVRNAPEGFSVTIQPTTRTLEQNSLLWPLLTEISDSVDWYGKKLTPDEWKDVFTAGLKRNKVVPGIDGGFVVVGASTSKMDKKTFSELLELIYAFGAERGIKFREREVA